MIIISRSHLKKYITPNRLLPQNPYFKVSIIEFFVYIPKVTVTDEPRKFVILKRNNSVNSMIKNIVIHAVSPSKV